MKPVQETETRVTVLSYISQGWGIRRIARYIGISHPAVIKHVKILEKKQYIARIFRSTQVQYSILPLGQEILNSHNGRLPPPEDSTLTGGSKRLPPPEEDLKIRAHRLQIKFDLVSPIKDPSIISFHDHPSKIVPLEHWQKNIIQFEDFMAIISTKSLIITGVQRYLKVSDNVESQEADIMSEIIPFAEQVEEKIRRLHPEFRLKRLDRGVISGKIISREYAYEHHPISEKSGQMMIRDREDNRPRIIVDKSKGFPELETVHPQHAGEDMEQLRLNTEVLATTDLREAIHALTLQIQTVSELVKHASTSQDQMDQVISVMGSITRVLGAGISK